jgi:hypothetical protein
MKWFKHISKSRFDAKIMRLIRKHGLRGYGLYFAILEGIAFDLEPEKPLPELEQTAHDIADFFGEDTIKIEEIVQDCIGEGLFDINGETGSIRCLKLLTYLDNTMSQNPQIRAILDNFNRNENKKIKETLSPLKQIRLDKPILDKIRQDEINTDTKPKRTMSFIQPTIDEVKTYLSEKSITCIDAESFVSYYEARGWMLGKVKVKNWHALISTWVKNNNRFNKTNTQTKAVAGSNTQEFIERLNNKKYTGPELEIPKGL